MRRRFGLAITMACLLAAACAGGGDRATGEGAAEAPLLDRELFFGDPEIAGAQLSPDGAFMTFIKPYRDVRNLWIKPLDAPFEDARPITADDRPVPGYFWSRDGDYVLYVQDKGGNEDFHVFAVDPTAAADDATGVPPARNLTPVEGARATIYSVPKSTPGEIVVGLNDRDARFNDVYRVDIATGERTLVLRNDRQVASFVFDLQGDARMAIRQTDDGSTELLRFEDDGSLERVYGCTYEETCSPTRFHKDGKRVYITSNKGDRDLTALMLLDLETGETTFVEDDPEGRVDFGGATFHPETDELIATAYLGDRLRIYPKTDAVAEDLAFLRSKLPDGEINLTSMTRDMKSMLVAVSRDVDPGAVYLYDRAAESVDLQYRSRPELPTEHLAPMKPVRYTARDGLEIPGYLTLPAGVEPEGLPTVIYVHGGPWARDTWGYEPFAQFLANRGYAVFQINFRSSTGYGKAFLNAGNREWGIGAMQHDITDGVRYLIDEGIADPDRIGIFGGSYGGYATLAGVTFTPDLYACAVPYVAPSNIITLIESFPAYWRPFLEGSWYKRVGDPEVAADREDMAARSPLNFVDRIRVPMLVVHGANDPRVKQAESDRIVAALHEKGHAVEYLVAPDEGHGFRAPENNLALAAAMERFLADHLGGRYQDEMPEAVATRLDALRVDPATVASEAGASAEDATGS